MTMGGLSDPPSSSRRCQRVALSLAKACPLALARGGDRWLAGLGCALGSAKGLACWRTVARFVLALCRTGADRARGSSRQGFWLDVHGRVHRGV